MGLFFVFRERICNRRRTSASRPTTGSMLPSAASRTRSLAYWRSVGHGVVGVGSCVGNCRRGVAGSGILYGPFELGGVDTELRHDRLHVAGHFIESEYAGACEPVRCARATLSTIRGVG